MPGPNRDMIKRRLGHLFTSITRRPFLKEGDKAESALGWSISRGLHPIAHQFLTEYGDKFQIHVQTPFKKLNLYTATLTIVGEHEALLQTKFCPTPVDALSNLRVMITVCEDPGKKERLAKLQEEALHAEQEVEAGTLDKEKVAREHWNTCLARANGKRLGISV